MACGFCSVFFFFCKRTDSSAKQTPRDGLKHREEWPFKLFQRTSFAFNASLCLNLSLCRVANKPSCRIGFLFQCMLFCGW